MKFLLIIKLNPQRKLSLTSSLPLARQYKSVPSLPSCPLVPSELQRARATSLFRFILTRHKSPAMSEFVHRKTTQLPPRRTRVAVGGRGRGGVFLYWRLTGGRGNPLGQLPASLGTIKGSEKQIAADNVMVRILAHRLCASPGWKRCPLGPQTSLNKKGWAGNYIWGHHPQITCH